MSKFTTATLLIFLMVGLLFLGSYEWDMREGAIETGVEISFHASERQVTDCNAREEEVKKIALTFDDGPHPTYTEKLLDGLKERGVVATFFVTGEHVVLHPDIITRMHEEGHLIGNHTYSHMQLKSNNREEFKEELIATSEVIEEIIQEEVVYVRPPYGSWDKSFEKELNMIPVLWNVDPLDWCSTDVTGIVKKIVKETDENDIILMHDYFKTSVEAALLAVDILQEKGYTFVTVEEILFD